MKHLDNDKRFQNEWYRTYVENKWQVSVNYYACVLFEHIKEKICETHESLDKEEKYIWHGYKFIDSFTNKETTFCSYYKRHKDDPFVYDIGDFPYDENGEDILYPEGIELEKYLFDKVIQMAIHDWQEDIRQTIWKQVMRRKDEILKMPRRKKNVVYADLLNNNKKDNNDLLLYINYNDNNEFIDDTDQSFIDNIFDFYLKNDLNFNEQKINAIYALTGFTKNSRKLVKLSKTFVEQINKHSNEFSKEYNKLAKLDDEHGVIFFEDEYINDTYIVYDKTPDDCLEFNLIKMWVFDGRLSIPIFYTEIILDNFIFCNNSIDLVDIKHDDNYNDYIKRCKSFLLGYLYLREYSNVELKEVKEKLRKSNTNNINLEATEELTYFVFDSKWYTEICNDNEISVCGHFRHQNYADGSRKPIWINSFTRHGYHRKASIDKYKDGELVLD